MGKLSKPCEHGADHDNRRGNHIFELAANDVSEGDSLHVNHGKTFFDVLEINIYPAHRHAFVLGRGASTHIAASKAPPPPLL